jgi:hypothetical protein
MIFFISLILNINMRKTLNPHIKFFFGTSTVKLGEKTIFNVVFAQRLRGCQTKTRADCAGFWIRESCIQCRPLNHSS